MLNQLSANTQYDWIGGKPEQTDDTNFDWSGGTPFIIYEAPAPPTGIQDKSAHMASKLVAAGVI